jgi:hypothetical protein
MHKFKAPSWMIDWQKKYQPMLVDGLTDGPTYVRLVGKSLPALDVVLALRPMVGRITDDSVMVGGKLSVFRIFSGKLQGDSTVLNATRGNKERVGQLLLLKGEQGWQLIASARYNDQFVRTAQGWRFADSFARLSSAIGRCYKNQSRRSKP